MRQHNQLIQRIGHRIQLIKDSPATEQIVMRTDAAIQYMTRPDYTHSNPALAEVRTSLITGLWCMLALAVVAILWGTLAPIDSAAVARGSVALLTNKKTVQHLEGGVIEALLVKEGDAVKAGQPLIRLDNASANANRDTVEGQLFLARANENRLLSERDKKEEIAFDPDLKEQAAKDDKLAKILEDQTQLFTVRREAQAAKVNALNEHVAQAKDEIDGLKAQKEGTAGQLSLLDEEIDTVQGLLEKGYTTKSRLLELERRRSELQGGKGQYGAQVAKAYESITETQMDILNEQNEFASKNAQELRDARAQIAELESKLKAAQDVANRIVITAPCSGIVTGLKFHTPGGVIQPGVPIMDIVPQDDQLIIEARVNPSDIDVVRPGLPARVMFSSFKARSTPRIPGTVTQVSADKFTDEHSAPPNSYYIARIEVDKAFIHGLQKPLSLYPGMPASVMINTGSRSFFGYLFQPITDSMNKAFREK